ncbi:class I SAM-dependent methyltransferase [Solicola gregarius]|uniref:Class I SAM-dependent methyltransferase n=1 Tax=Solicola gregarius TaxID=2908642 RepID=A0AA46TLQ7_9ACTN|nr:class I SAM-dependent methyltransferase [Solicola gregarius]UYM07596.1 class I SAM-dependent methyltransferase [Solicola gregarius]
MHTQHQAHGAFAGRSTRRYDFMARRLMRGFYRRIAEDVALLAPNGADILDVGTGPGVLLTETARRRPDVSITGIDPSADMIAAATRNIEPYPGRVHARIGSAAEVPSDDAAFDLVVTSLSLHHWDDVAASVAELARVLRPGGQIVVFDLARAPFGELDAAADAHSGLSSAACHTTIGTGVPHVRRIERHVLHATAEAAQPR